MKKEKPLTIFAEPLTNELSIIKTSHLDHSNFQSRKEPPANRKELKISKPKDPERLLST